MPRPSRKEPSPLAGTSRTLAPEHPLSHALSSHPGGNPGANRWFLLSSPIQMPPELGGICGRLTGDLPLGSLQGDVSSETLLFLPCVDERLQQSGHGHFGSTRSEPRVAKVDRATLAAGSLAAPMAHLCAAVESRSHPHTPIHSIAAGAWGSNDLTTMPRWSN